MQRDHGVTPDAVSFGTALATCRNAGESSGLYIYIYVYISISIYRVNHGVTPDAVSFGTALATCRNAGEFILVRVRVRGEL